MVSVTERQRGPGAMRVTRARVYLSGRWQQPRPRVVIALGARVKRPGEAMDSESTELKVVQQPSADDLEPYERLLGEAMAGDTSLFARQDGVEAAWAVVDPVLDDATPLYPYRCGSWGPAEADTIPDEVNGWHEAGRHP